MLKSVVGQWNHGIEGGPASYGKKCIQIEDQLSTVITAINKAGRRSTTSILSCCLIGKVHEPQDDVVGTTSISRSSRGLS